MSTPNPPGIVTIPASTQILPEDEVRIREVVKGFGLDAEKIERQAAKTEGVIRAKGIEIQAASQRVQQNLINAQGAQVLQAIGTRKKVEEADRQREIIRKRLGPETLDKLFGPSSDAAAKDLAEAAAAVDAFETANPPPDGSGVFGNLRTKLYNRAAAPIRQKFDATVIRWQQLQNAIASATQNATGEAQAAAVLANQGKSALEQEAELRGIDAEFGLKIEQEKVAGAKEAMNVETTILELRKGTAGARATFFEQLHKLNALKGQNVDLELRKRQLALMDVQLRDMANDPAQSALILEKLPISQQQLAAMNTEQRVEAIKMATATMQVRNLADQKEVATTTGVIQQFHPNPLTRYASPFIAKAANQDASAVSAEQALVAETGKGALSKEGAQKQKQLANFMDARPVEFVSPDGSKAVKTPVQFVADYYVRNPGGSGRTAFVNKYAEDFVKSGRPGAVTIQKIRDQIVAGTINPNTSFTTDMWKAAAGGNAREFFGAYSFLQEQVVQALPWKEYGMSAPKANFELYYTFPGIPGVLSTEPKQMKFTPRNEEDVVNLFQRMEAAQRSREIVDLNFGKGAGSGGEVR